MMNKNKKTYPMPKEIYLSGIFHNINSYKGITPEVMETYFKGLSENFKSAEAKDFCNQISKKAQEVWAKGGVSWVDKMVTLKEGPALQIGIKLPVGA